MSLRSWGSMWVSLRSSVSLSKESVSMRDDEINGALTADWSICRENRLFVTDANVPSGIFSIEGFES